MFDGKRGNAALPIKHSGLYCVRDPKQEKWQRYLDDQINRHL